MFARRSLLACISAKGNVLVSVIVDHPFRQGLQQFLNIVSSTSFPGTMFLLAGVVLGWHCIQTMEWRICFEVATRWISYLALISDFLLVATKKINQFIA